MAKAKKAVYPEWVKTEQERRMHDSFRAFLWFIWKQLALPPPTPIQYDIAHFIQHGGKRIIVEAFRGVGKSWITAAFVLWTLYRNPQAKILVVSASKERADAFSIFVKQLIGTIQMLNFLMPKADQRSSNLAFDVGPATPDQAPSVKSVGITGQLTGSRADIIVSDDVEVPGNSGTEDQREQLAQRTAEYSAILKPNGRVVVLGTPQNAQSLYNILAKRGYTMRVWPARHTSGTDADGNDVYGGRLAPYLIEQYTPEVEGKSTEPSRFTDVDLLEREADYGRSGFALQFMLNTSLSDANRYPLKVSDLMIMDLDRRIAPVQLTWASGHQQVLPEVPNVGLNGDRAHRPMYVSEAHVEYQGAVMFVDPKGRGADECAYCVTKMLNGLIFVTAWGGIRGNGFSDETLGALAAIAKEHKVNEIVPEVNFGDGMFNTLLAGALTKPGPDGNPFYPCTIIDDHRVSGQKEVRIIEKLEPALNQHRVVMDKSVAIANAPEPTGASDERLVFSGLYQLTHITRDRGSLRHDDRVDVLAEAVGYWTEKLLRDNKGAEERHAADLRAKTLDRFMMTVTGKHAPKHKNYLKSDHGDRGAGKPSLASAVAALKRRRGDFI